MGVNDIYKDANLPFSVTPKILPYNRELIRFSSQDKGIARLVFEMRQGKNPYNLTGVTGEVTLVMANGSRFIEEATILDPTSGTVEYILTDEQLRCVGKAKGELILKLPNQSSVAGFLFEFVIEASLKDKDLEPIEEYYFKDFIIIKEKLEGLESEVDDLTVIQVNGAKKDTKGVVHTSLDSRISAEVGKLEEKQGEITTQLSKKASQTDLVATNQLLTQIGAKQSEFTTQLADIAYNVKGLGVLGNGTDESVKLQSIITSLKSGSVLYFPNGTYNFNVQITKDLIIRGESNAILQNVSGEVFSVKNGCKNITIEGLTFENCNRTIGFESGWEGDNIRILNNNIKQGSIVISGCKSVSGIILISGNSLNEGRPGFHGISVGSTTIGYSYNNLIISQNTIRKYGTYPAPENYYGIKIIGNGNYSQIIGNVIRDCSFGIDLSFGGRRTIVQNNVLYNNQGGIVSKVEGVAGTYRTDGSFVEQNIIANNFVHVVAGTNPLANCLDLRSGNTLVNNNIFTLNDIVDTSAILVIGTDKSQMNKKFTNNIVIGGYANNPSNAIYPTGIRVDGDGLLATGNIIYGFGRAIYCINSNYCDISHNKIVDFTNSGIYLNISDGKVSERNRFTGNFFENLYSKTAPIRNNNAIVVVNNTSGICRDTIISENNHDGTFLENTFINIFSNNLNERVVINGVSYNSGDPNSVGAWLGKGKDNVLVAWNDGVTDKLSIYLRTNYHGSSARKWVTLA